MDSLTPSDGEAVNDACLLWRWSGKFGSTIENDVRTISLHVKLSKERSVVQVHVVYSA